MLFCEVLALQPKLEITSCLFAQEDYKFSFRPKNIFFELAFWLSALKKRLSKIKFTKLNADCDALFHILEPSYEHEWMKAKEKSSWLLICDSVGQNKVKFVHKVFKTPKNEKTLSSVITTVNTRMVLEGSKSHQNVTKERPHGFEQVVSSYDDSFELYVLFCQFHQLQKL